MSRERIEQAIRRRQLAVENGLRIMLDDPDGRAFLWWLLELAGVNRISAARATDQSDFMPHATMFAEGQRNIGNIILSRLLDLDPVSYARMIQENRPQRVEGGLGANIISDDD